MDAKTRRMNLEDPFELDIVSQSDGKFTLQFEANGKRVRIRMQRWWVAPLAEKLHAYMTAEQNRLDGLKAALKGES
jgi:hypothetical protein